MKRRVLVCVALSVLVASLGHAYILPVTDAGALIKHTAMLLLERKINGVRQEQAERIYKMSLRISHWTSLAKYVIHRDFMPEWRIHNWFTDDVLYAKPYNFALTYGDAHGDGYTQVTLPRQDATDVLAWLSPAAAAVMRSQLALIDLADSAIIRGTHETGRIRFNGRAEADAIIKLDAAATDGDFNDSLSAVLDKVTAANLIEVQNKQTRAQLEVATLEQLIVGEAWDRDGEAALNNMRIKKLQADQDDEGAPPSFIDGATSAITGWHLLP